MTLRTVVRSTRGIIPGDTVARLLPDGGTDLRYFRVHGVASGYLVYREERHLVYLLTGTTPALGRAVYEVKMIVTGNAPWCVSR